MFDAHTVVSHYVYLAFENYYIIYLIKFMVDHGLELSCIAQFQVGRILRRIVLFTNLFLLS